MERGAGTADLRRLQRPGFPKAFKASPLLRAWLRRLDAMGVQFALRHRWIGWDENGQLAFQTPDGQRASIPARPCWRSAAQAGRGSARMAHGWKRSPRRAWRYRRCGRPIAASRRWSDIFRDRFEGQPLKGVALSFGAHTVRGEAMVTRTGIEGGAIYALSADCARRSCATGQATLHVALAARSRYRRVDRAAVRPRKASSPCPIFCARPQSVAALRSACCRRRRITSGGVACRRCRLRTCRLINAVPIELNGVAPIARAISTAGGIAFDELDADFMIRRLPGVFAAGEMLDWEAPTGGYLLQASFATGAARGGVR
jgi:predicted flavoprotein YhiN